MISFSKDFPTSSGIKVIQESVLVDCVVENEHSSLTLCQFEDAKKRGGGENKHLNLRVLFVVFWSICSNVYTSFV